MVDPGSHSTELGKQPASAFLGNTRHCEICGSEHLSDLFPMEMMHGKAGPFHYVRCQDCLSIYQPVKLPDYSQFYPDSYYSFRYEEPHSLSARLRQFKRMVRNRYYYFGQGLLGRWLAAARPCPTNHLSRHVKLRQNMSILEIGSGSGELLHELADLGIRRVVGIDPFVPQDLAFRNGAQVFKLRIDQLNQRFQGEKFDLIMFNHALEHSPTPFEDLRQVARFLSANGEILLRLPVSGSTVADQYGTSWWSLDAPRHIYIFSTKSMPLVAQRCGLNVKRVHHEGTIDDYLASEQHQAGVRLLDPRSYVVSKDFSAFSNADLERFQAAIADQNSAGTSAQAGFVLGF